MIVRITSAASVAIIALQLLPTVSAQTSKGCYTSPGDLVNQGSYRWQSYGHCGDTCKAIGKPVMAFTDGSNCWCGDLLPNPSDKTSDSACSTPCFGYGQDSCGGTNAWQVFLTGLSNDVGSVAGGGDLDAGSVPAPSPSTSEVVKTIQGKVTTVKPTVVTIGGGTIVRTLEPTTSPTDGASSGSPDTQQGTSSGSSSGSKIGVAVGVVVGVVLLAIIIAGIVLYFRRKKKQNSHIRQSSIHGFARGGGSGAASVTDSRLDPSMVERRNSVGSVFADNEDYSRRILKVTNPDGT